jgi:D-sedoheptulose 7-phosphate isomerase
VKKLKFKDINDAQIIKVNFNESIIAKNKFFKEKSNIKNLIQIIKIIKSKFSKGGKIYFAGNGGSASDSSHLSCELVSKLTINRNAIPAISLVDNACLITAISNDYNFKEVFKRQLEANLKKDDIFFAISTSGKSKNIIEALKYCKKQKITSILLTGNLCGKAKFLSNYSIHVPSDRTQTIQEIHILIGHCICEALEASLKK